jgi:hypothetical protein
VGCGSFVRQWDDMEMHAGVQAEIHQPVTDEIEHGKGILGIGVGNQVEPWRVFPIGAYLRLFSSLPMPALCHLLPFVRLCTSALWQPDSPSGFLMSSTSWTTTEKAGQTGETRLEVSLRPAALPLLP